jgi:ATPase subunit of ABC transporter with duplicated ATPase domains
LSCRRIQKAFGDRMVLSDIDLDITQGDRIALVGRNGAGKSTLANILTGSMDYDYGTIISSRQEFSIGYLRQTEAEPELFMKVLKMETEVNGEFQRLSSHLGINQLKNCSGERIQKLSGGEKTKIALARVWAAHPELLILDEPTNHMDYQGINFLISELSAYKGAAIIISHDRYFLDHTVSKIAELDNGKLKITAGTCSQKGEIRRCGNLLAILIKTVQYLINRTITANSDYMLIPFLYCLTSDLGGFSHLAGIRNMVASNPLTFQHDFGVFPTFHRPAAS